MKKWVVSLLALSLLLAGCTAVPGDTNDSGTTEATVTEATEETIMWEPKAADVNGNGKVVWCALGDSITQGYYSYLENGEGKIKTSSTECWAGLLSKELGMTLLNSGVGGSGYVHLGTVLDKLNARDHIESKSLNNFAGVELVTLAFGVNDWKGNDPLGSMDDDVAQGGTFYSNMRYVIETIQKKNPNLQIVVISPINATRFGIESKGWGLGYKFSNNGTLEDIFDAMQEVCNYYGLPMIDMLHNEAFNSNLEEYLADGVHPTLDGHKKMAEILKAEMQKLFTDL